MGSYIKNLEKVVLDYIYDKIGASELNSITDVEVEEGNIWITLEDGSIKSLVVVSAGKQERQNSE